MTAGFVLDASVVLGWGLAEQETFARARSVLMSLKTTRAVVPAIWQAEVANSLVTKERQRRIDESHVERLIAELQDLPIEVDHGAGRDTFTNVLPVARRHNLSVYDACYLELALRAKVALASFDNALREAAKREGIGLFEGLEE